MPEKITFKEIINVFNNWIHLFSKKESFLNIVLGGVMGYIFIIIWIIF